MNGAPAPDALDIAKQALTELSEASKARIFDYCLKQIEEELNTALDADAPTDDHRKASIRIDLLRELSGLVLAGKKMQVTLPDNS